MIPGSVSNIDKMGRRRLPYLIDKQKDGMVVSILLTLLDITNEKKLEEIANDKAQENKLIGELIEIPSETMKNFFESVDPMFNEICQLLDDFGLQSLHVRLPKQILNFITSIHPEHSFEIFGLRSHVEKLNLLLYELYWNAKYCLLGKRENS